MKNGAAIVGAVLLGLLFVGCATSMPQDPERAQHLRKMEALRAAWSQDPERKQSVPKLIGWDVTPKVVQDPEPVARQAPPPSFRDVLRGKVGQKCQAGALHGVWVLQFSVAGQAEEAKKPVGASTQVPSEKEMTEMFPDLHVTTIAGIRHEALKDLATELVQQRVEGNVAVVSPTRVVTLVAVGTDFVQVREADGTEQYIPLSRVDVIVRSNE